MPIWFYALTRDARTDGIADEAMKLVLVGNAVHRDAVTVGGNDLHQTVESVGIEANPALDAVEDEGHDAVVVQRAAGGFGDGLVESLRVQVCEQTDGARHGGLQCVGVG
jgi:hypothetical protein